MQAKTRKYIKMISFVSENMVCHRNFNKTGLILKAPDANTLYPAVSHISQFGDATTSLTGDVDVSAGDANL